MADKITFDFETEAGATIHAPKFDTAMSAGFLRKYRNADVAEQMFALVENALDEDALALFDTLSISEMERFYTLWQEDSGITAGE